MTGAVRRLAATRSECAVATSVKKTPQTLATRLSMTLYGEVHDQSILVPRKQEVGCVRLVVYERVGV
jgi:hypothetical protein